MPIGLEASALDLQLELLTFLRSRLDQLLRRLDKRLHPDRLQRGQHGFGNRLLQRKATAYPAELCSAIGERTFIVSDKRSLSGLGR